ncbi:deoxyuridine 5'-triphosphate nucleotidohydrolase [Mycena rosella]|uniref:Deoxyuridine 5'-triphosphate nucleotidohydrolase n=1 Tax=Mycena rosella TaxID=1033263 RepID=A0AAD7DZ57_MYCRO|nr:deoxyuridine 5'-triphosphate nucleotidohydrolase [Mycena rosella]
MILPGHVTVARGIIRGVQSHHLQVQPCGVDLTLLRISRWTSMGVVDFENLLRKKATTEELPFIKDSLHLDPGAYLVQFAETVSTPDDTMGQIYVRSSLFRSGATIHAGLMDAGYSGSVGALLQVLNPYGIQLHRGARLAQLVFHEMKEKVNGYSGIYQGAETV